MAEDLAREVGRLYEDAEAALLERLAAALEADIDSPRWAELKFAAVGNLRTAVESVAEALQQDADGMVRQALVTAYTRGRQAAVSELGALDVGRELVARATLPNAPAVDRLAASMAQDTRPLYQRITRAVTDTFRSVVSRVSGGLLLGGMTRRQASQRALNQFAARGITGFVDKAGRNWDMAAYAEMAVRSVTARAVVEGHIDALAEIGIGLVIVSDAPLECPLCAAWEGEVLTLSGQSGPHTLRVEHATEDGQIVVVHLAGTLIEARAAGLFHPNCRHSLSAYMPGVTRRPQSPPHPQGATYEDTQQQRYLERQVRRWKRVAAASMDEPARRRANAHVREYQARIRQLVDEKGLRRKREREQLATTSTATPAPESLAVARLRANPGALHEMSEEQLGDAERSGRLDASELQRIGEERDRRATEQLLERARPGGQLVADLSGLSDDDLDALLPHLSPEETLRLAEEMDRRETLARVFPGGRLTETLAALDEDTLGWALRYANAEEAERIAAEMDRRDEPPPLPTAQGAETITGQLADRAAVDEALRPAAPPDEWPFLADDAPDPYEGMTSTERWIAEREAEEQSARGAYTRDEVREMYREYVYVQYLAAEDELRGVFLTKRAALDGVDPITLFSGPSHVAYSRASEELKRWWAEHPRTTLAEYTEQVTGRRSEAGETARAARDDQQNRL
jgi:hypothetical protein